MPIQPTKPTTLREKLVVQSKDNFRNLWSPIFYVTLLGALAGVYYFHPTFVTASLFFWVALLLFCLSRTRWFSFDRENFLLANDKQGFMGALKLSDKTVLIDGSNIFHFGMKNAVGPQALRQIIKGFRADGYRVICFFDANIYFTLMENGNFVENGQRFSTQILQHVFGLNPREIYVVPSGSQADLFIVESLSHLPISFAVTNDRFRDYENKYAVLAEDNRWRKGVTLVSGELKVQQYKFKKPLLTT